ncbi:MAG: sigma-70 family RNA polymerase sigma factor [bacterium]|nr:sigma-70 family RNA polymerase sigma factor [bacterium]
MKSEPVHKGEPLPRESAEALAVRARAGSRAAFGALVERYEGPLFRFLRLRSASDADAEELTQEAFLRAWRRIERYDERWRFSTWLFTVAKRIAASRVRRASLPMGMQDVVDLASARGDPALEVSARDEGRNVWHVAHRVLSVEQCSALWLFYVEELPARDVARILERRESTTRVLLFRARERLALHLAEPAAPGPSGTVQRSLAGGHP